MRRFLLLLVVAGSVLVLPARAGAAPPKACTRALQLAETERALFEDYAAATREYMRNATAARTLDESTTALRAYTAKLDAISRVLVPNRANYEKAAKACRRS